MAGEYRLGCMPFWVDDWLQDEEVQRMPPVARDAYFWLICVNWRSGSLPSSPRVIAQLLPSSARVSREFRASFERVWNQYLSTHFVPCGDGRITNKRLQVEKNRVLTYKQRKAEAGRKGGRKTQAVLQAVLKHPTPTPTPTPTHPAPSGAGEHRAASCDLEDATDFLFGFLCPPARDYEKDLEALRKIAHEPGDLDDWKKTLAWYVKHGGPKDPVSFVRSRFLSYRHPKDCLKEWDEINNNGTHSAQLLDEEELQRQWNEAHPSYDGEGRRIS